MKKWIFFWAGLSLLGCRPESESGDSLRDLINAEALKGRTAYLESPFVTAGDRLYMVGHQDGSFPELGWHVPGEMGGIWDHPIKLMDGFVATLDWADESTCLLRADTFLNYPFANEHLYTSLPEGLEVKRLQFVPDQKEAIVIEYHFRNNSGQDRTLTFNWTAFTDLRPVWLGDRTGMKDGEDYTTWLEDIQAWSAKDSLNEWYVVFGAPQPASDRSTEPVDCGYAPRGQGTTASLSFTFEVPAGGFFNLPITIAGSYHSLGEAKQTFAQVSQESPQFLREKQLRYDSLAERSRLTVPDKQLELAFEWLKYNTDWLIRDVPETGRGLSAGLPDYPWWFGVDNEYSLQGALMIGREDIVYETIDLLHQLSEKTNGNGRIIHEASTNGAVFNPGNINETPQFASLIWQAYQWTGDEQLLTKYFPTIQKGLDWLLRENDADGNLLPDGFGMMEIHGLNSEMIDVAAYTQRAFADASRMAGVLGKTKLEAAYRERSESLTTIINSDFWVPEYNSYADFIGTTGQALHLIEDAMVRADTLNKPWAVAELDATRKKIAGYSLQRKQGFVLHHNWVVNTPMEMGIADSSRALAALETGSRFVNPFGVFVTGIDRDDSAGKDDGSFAAGKKIFNYTGAVMTLPTGVQAVAENNYGRPDRALDYLQRMTRTFGYALPGSMYEVSPDFGMMTQAWNLYSFAVPIVQQFFGVQPRAAEKTIRLQPQLPTDWDAADLENVWIGENRIDVIYKRKKNGNTTLEVRQASADWMLEIAFPAGQFREWSVDGKLLPVAKEGAFDVLEVRGDIVLNLQ